MISALLQPFEGIKDSPLITRWGGLALPVQEPIFNENTEVAKLLTLPVSLKLANPKCWETRTAYELVPNDTEKGISYIELINAPTYDVAEGLPARYQLYNVRMTVRVVVWLNLPRLGHTEMDKEAEIMAEIVGRVSPFYKNGAQGINKIKIRKTGLEIDGQSIFANYKYPQSTNGLFNYPYYVFAVDFEITGLVTDYCVSTYDPLTTILCY